MPLQATTTFGTQQASQEMEVWRTFSDVVRPSSEHPSRTPGAGTAKEANGCLASRVSSLYIGIGPRSLGTTIQGQTSKSPG